MNLNNLSDADILQMQWDILEQLKQSRVTPKSNEEVLGEWKPVEKETLTPKLNIMGHLRDAFEKPKTKTVKTNTPKKSHSRQRRILPPEVLPNGLELVQTHCKLYNPDVYYAGGA